MNRRLLLLDTGPLREMLAYQAVHILNFKNLERDLKFFTHPAAFEGFGNFINSFQKKTVPSSVIVELYYWIRKKTLADGHSRIWKLLYDEFQRMGMTEEPIKLLELYETKMDLLVRCGPTDCSVLHLSEINLNLDPVVLTIDNEVHAECARKKIEAKHLREIIV